MTKKDLDKIVEVVRHSGGKKAGYLGRIRNAWVSARYIPFQERREDCFEKNICLPRPTEAGTYTCKKISDSCVPSRCPRPKRRSIFSPTAAIEAIDAATSIFTGIRGLFGLIKGKR